MLAFTTMNVFQSIKNEVSDLLYAPLIIHPSDEEREQQRAKNSKSKSYSTAIDLPPTDLASLRIKDQYGDLSAWEHLRSETSFDEPSSPDEDTKSAPADALIPQPFSFATIAGGWADFVTLMGSPRNAADDNQAPSPFTFEMLGRACQSLPALICEVPSHMKFRAPSLLPAWLLAIYANGLQPFYFMLLCVIVTALFGLVKAVLILLLPTLLLQWRVMQLQEFFWFITKQDRKGKWMWKWRKGAEVKVEASSSRSADEEKVRKEGMSPRGKQETPTL
jgi:hypothetical protein